MALHGFCIADAKIDIEILLRLPGIGDIETLGVPKRSRLLESGAKFLNVSGIETVNSLDVVG